MLTKLFGSRRHGTVAGVNTAISPLLQMPSPAVAVSSVSCYSIVTRCHVQTLEVLNNSVGVQAMPPGLARSAALGLEGEVESYAHADPAALQMADGDGSTPLHLAARCGRDHAAALLLKLGADATARDRCGAF